MKVVGIMVKEMGRVLSGFWMEKRTLEEDTLVTLSMTKKKEEEPCSSLMRIGKFLYYSSCVDLMFRYDGFWKNNKPCGEGRMIYKNGDVYVGQWFEGKRNGYGVLTKRNGDHFEGSWVNDLREGQGSYFYAESNKLFVGEYVNDMPKCGIYSEVVDDQISEEEQLKKEMKMPDFDDIPPLPKLELKDPVGVLQTALNNVRSERMFYRARYMTLHVLYQPQELNDLIQEFSASAGEEGEVDLEVVPEMLDRLGIECDLENLFDFYLKLVCESEEEMEEIRANADVELKVDFELFARIVAIVLEMNNKLEEKL